MGFCTFAGLPQVGHGKSRSGPLILATGGVYFGLVAHFPHFHKHEQVNARLKGDGGIIGITENEEALRKWLLAAPEVSDMLLHPTVFVMVQINF